MVVAVAVELCCDGVWTMSEQLIVLDTEGCFVLAVQSLLLTHLLSYSVFFFCVAHTEALKIDILYLCSFTVDILVFWCLF